MTTYHIIKASRIYEGKPYKGSSSLYKELTYTDLAITRSVVNSLNKINPVGWEIYNNHTGEIIE